MLVWPESAPFQYVDRHPEPNARNAVHGLFERVDRLDVGAMGETDAFGDAPPFIRLSDAAQALFIEWYDDFMQHSRRAEKTECAALAAHFGKYPGLVGKLALILHVADDPNSKAVSERSLVKALSWLEYLEPHARRVYHGIQHPETGAAELLLSRLRRGELPAQFSARDVYRKCWHGLSDKEAVKRACALLVDFVWLIEVETAPSSNGRPADPLYRLSPAAAGAL